MLLPDVALRTGSRASLRTSLRTSLRIIWAIASKDIVDAFRNKNVLGNLISVAFIIVMYQYLPVLGKLSDAPRLYVYDAGSSSLVAALEESAAVPPALRGNVGDYPAVTIAVAILIIAAVVILRGSAPEVNLAAVSRSTPMPRASRSTE